MYLYGIIVDNPVWRCQLHYVGAEWQRNCLFLLCFSFGFVICFARHIIDRVSRAHYEFFAAKRERKKRHSWNSCAWVKHDGLLFIDKRQRPIYIYSISSSPMVKPERNININKSHRSLGICERWHVIFYALTYFVGICYVFSVSFRPFIWL